MASLGEISVALVADTSKFDAGIKRASSAAAGAAGAIGALAGVALGAVAGIGALGAATIKMTTDLALAGDAAAKAGTRMGVTAEAVQELAYAADLSGASMQDVEKAFLKVGKNANDMAGGTGEAKDAFDRLGISVKDANGNLKSNEQLFNESADALAGLNSDTERAALAQEIFGKSGAKLLPMLKGGAEGMAEMRQEAQDLGFVISNETAAASEAFNDNMLRLNKTFEGVKVKILSDLMPSFNAMSETAVQIAKDFTKTGDSTSTMKTGINELADAVKAAAPAMAVLGGTIGFLVDLVKTAYVAMGGFALALHAASTAGAYLDAQLADTEEGWARYEMKLKELNTASERLDKTTQSLGDTTMSGVEFGDKMAAALGKLADAAKRGANELGVFVGPTMDQAGLSASDLADRVNDAGDAFDKAKTKGKSFAETLREIEVAAQRAAAATSDVTDAAIMSEVDFINRKTKTFKTTDTGPTPGMIGGVEGARGNRGGTASGRIDADINAITAPLAESFMNVGSSADAMSSVLGGLTGGLGTVVTLFADMWTQSEGFVKIMERVNGLLEPFQSFIDDIAMTAFDALKPVFDILDALAPVIKLVLTFMNPLILPLKLIGLAMDALSKPLQRLKWTIEDIIDWFKFWKKKEQGDTSDVTALEIARRFGYGGPGPGTDMLMPGTGNASEAFGDKYGKDPFGPKGLGAEFDALGKKVTEFGDTMAEVTGSLTNVPEIFRANLRQTQASGGLSADRGAWAGTVGGMNGGSALAGAGMRNGVYIQNAFINSDTPETFAQRVDRRQFVTTGSVGASNATNLVYGLASAG